MCILAAQLANVTVDATGRVHRALLPTSTAGRYKLCAPYRNWTPTTFPPPNIYVQLKNERQKGARLRQSSSEDLVPPEP